MSSQESAAAPVDVPVDSVGAFVSRPAVLLEGRVDGPLSGMTLAVKDLFDIEGIVTGAGNPTYTATHRAAESTAVAVQRLVDAGATVVGKTITDEMAYSLSGTNVHYGTPRNVNAPGRIPGGSSAGSAAAVAAGLVDLALGTDTGGSIRVPASYCGIAGWRPTHDAVSLQGVVPLAPSFDTAGLFARDPAVLLSGARALIGDGIGALHNHAYEYRAKVRFAVIAETLEDSSPEVADAVLRIAAGLGASPDPLSVGLNLDETLMAFRTRQGWEAWQAQGDWIRSTEANGGPRFGPGIASRFEAASRVTFDEVIVADHVRLKVRLMIDEATAADTILVMPAAAGAAPGAPADLQAHELQRSRTLRLTSIAGLAGVPVVVLPLARVDAMPLGIAFVGAIGSDLQLISAVASAARSLSTDGTRS